MYIKNISSDVICGELNKIYSACSDPRNDGWTAFRYKQDLIRIHFHLQKLLNDCPKFVDEEKFIEEIEKKLTWEIMKNDFR